jgi:hypothetical protein
MDLSPFARVICLYDKILIENYVPLFPDVMSIKSTKHCRIHICDVDGVRYCGYQKLKFHGQIVKNYSNLNKFAAGVIDKSITIAKYNGPKLVSMSTEDKLIKILKEKLK